MTGPIFTGAFIERVQHLSFGFVSTGFAFESIDCTLGVDAGEPVDASRTLLLNNIQADAAKWQDDTSPSDMLDSGVLYLLDDDTVRLNAESDATATTTLYFSLVEFYPGPFRRILRGAPTVAPHATTNDWTETDIPIGETINVDKSFLIVDSSRFGSGWQAANLSIYTKGNQFYLKGDGQNIVWRCNRNATAAASSYLLPWTIMEGY